MSIKLVNQPRVESILDREGLDGLVVVNPINFYYFSGYWGFFNTPTGFDGSYFSVLPRESDKKSSMVIPALEIRRIETKGRPWIKIFLPILQMAMAALLMTILQKEWIMRVGQ